MNELLSLHVTLKAYKQMLGKDMMTDQEFILWVRKETGTDTVDPIDVIDPIDKEEPKSLDDLSEEELNSLFRTIDRFEQYQDRIVVGDNLARDESAELTSLHLIISVYKEILGKDTLYNDFEFINWVRQETGHERTSWETSVPE